MIVVAGVTNLQFSVPVDGFPVTYVPVRYPQGQTGVRVAGVGYNVAAALAALGSAVRLATFAGDDLLGGAVETELRACTGRGWQAARRLPARWCCTSPAGSG